MIHSDFYDCQTENFELYAPASSNSFPVLGGLALLLFVSMFFCFLLIPNMETAFGVGLFAAVALLILVTDTPNIIKRRPKKLSEKVVNYSEHYLHSCIAQALQDEPDSPDLMDRAVGTLFLKKVVNAGDITKVTVKAHISEIYRLQRQIPYTKNTGALSPCSGCGIPKSERPTARCLWRKSAPHAAPTSFRMKTIAAPSAATHSSTTVPSG